ncbi:Transcription termination factor mitochondrial/chloroplastic protein [Dioscorea alata]|uniref:Transcription termination factor mitochondrial/chloroplastic protein n=1 Tax=Dioscorea alata TaxID=55571 RepID=A0ACB7WIL2_DIOAL|nr:Transcription termination factor mitochondrial/chloroplastic protein [Dioscorea alata]
MRHLPAIRLLCTVPPKLKNLSYRYRSRALSEARRAVTEYLHSTRALPFALADQIASNSPFSLSVLVSQIPFHDPSPLHIPRTLRRFLSYHPINEFDFFFESIGLPRASYPSPSRRLLFLSDDEPLLAAVNSLVRFGFPWTRLGILYREAACIFNESSELLVKRLRAFEALGLRRVCVIGICLAFPSVLTADCDPGGEIDLLLRDLKKVFVDFGMDDCAGDDVDVFFEICCRIRVFYHAGSVKGTMGEIMGRNQRVFLDLEGSFLAERLDFFRKLGMHKEKVGTFVLDHVEILDFDLVNTKISLLEYLRKVELSEEEVLRVSQECPFVMGRNKLSNLPGIMRATNLHEWFLDKITNDNYRYISPDFASNIGYDVKIDGEFIEDLERIKSVKMHEFLSIKLDFIRSIGFGENRITAKAVGLLNGTMDQLQERFDCLLELGIEYPMLCRIISSAPKVLNQGKDNILQKVNYLCNDLNYSLEYLENFPAFLCFDLENRIRPRYRILNWLQEIGLLKKPFSPATVLANSEKRFIINLWSIHPAAPKQWLECFSSRGDTDGRPKNIFSA